MAGNRQVWLKSRPNGIPQAENFGIRDGDVPAIAEGESTLILAPTGTGKTLTAFLWCLDRLMLHRPV